MKSALELYPAERDREGLDRLKFGFGFRVIVQGVLQGKIGAFLDRAEDFNPTAIAALTGAPVENVVLDIDACIVPPEEPIQLSALSWIDALRARGVRFGVYSNHISGNRLDPLEKEREIGIYRGKLAKPNPRGFLEVCEQMDFHPKRTWHIGDNPNTDSGAALVLGGFALVRAIPRHPQTRLNPWKWLKAPFQDRSRAVAVWRSTRDRARLITSAVIKSWELKNL